MLTHSETPSPQIQTPRQKTVDDDGSHKDIDSSRDRREDRPEISTPQTRDIGNDDVLQQEQTGDSEDIDGVSCSVGIDVLGGGNDDVSEDIQEDASEVGVDSTEYIGEFSDGRLRDCLKYRGNGSDCCSKGMLAESSRDRDVQHVS